MSTKIYDGLKLKDSNADLYEVIGIIARGIREEFDHQVHKLIANSLAEAVDYKTLRDESKGDDYLFYKVEEQWKKRQADFGRHHTLNDPLRFSIVFGRSSEGNILAVPYSANNADYKAVLDATELFEPYGYWNNTDHPEELTQAQWDARGEEWDSLTNNEGTFGDLPGWELGNSMDVWSHGFISALKEPDEDLNNYRSQRARLKAYITEALIGKLIEEDPDKSNPFAHVFTASRIARGFMATEESAEVPLPERLPDHFMVQFKDLPPLYEVAPELIESILARREELEN